MKKKCNHKHTHTQLRPYQFGVVYGYSTWNGEYKTVEVPPVNGSITTYCADCGVKLKEIELVGEEL